MKLKKLKFSLLTVLLDYLSGSPHPKSISVSMIPQAQVHLLLYPGSPFLSFVFHMSMRGLHELFFLLPPLLHLTNDEYIFMENKGHGSKTSVPAGRKKKKQR